jgi:hypothetical protein
MVTVTKKVKKPVKKVVKAAKAIKTSNVKDEELEVLYKGLPQRYHQYLAELEAEDQGIYMRHKHNYCTAGKDILADAELGIELRNRMQSLKEVGSDHENTYGRNLVRNLSILFEVPATRLYDAIHFVLTFGEVEALNIARTIGKNRYSITMSHLRSFRRLDSVDFTETRREILQEIYDGKLVTVKDIEGRIDGVLGVVQKVTGVIDPLAVHQTTPTDYEVPQEEQRENKSSSSERETKSDVDGDKSSSLRLTDIKKLSPASQLRDILSVVATSGNAHGKQWAELGVKLEQWQAGMKLEEVKNVDASIGLQAINELRQMCNEIKSVLAVVEEICKVITTAQQETKPQRRKTVTSNLAEVA